MMTIADYLIQKLIHEGVSTVYGLPGGENVELLDACHRHGLEFVLVKNESSALFMAATEARLTGHIGVAITTLGPGVTNAYVGIAHAFLDRAPVLLLTAQTDRSRIGVHTHQVLDIQAALRPVTRFTAELNSGSAVEMIELALASLRRGRPGPAHLGISNQTAKCPAPITLAPKANYPEKRLDRDQLGRASHALSRAKRPVIVVGLGLEPDQPYAVIQTLAEQLNAPVIDTPKSKGALSAEHPLFAGTLGLTATDPVYTLLNESDLILAIGFDVVELVKPWDQPQPLVWIANWENSDPPLTATAELVGPLQPLLESLQAVANSKIDPNWGANRVARFKKESRSSAYSPLSGRLSPQQMLQGLLNSLPDDAIVSTDVGSHKIFTALTYPSKRPNHYLVSNGLSAMGFGLTSAIAAARVTGQWTVAITGDAGFGMVIGELGLARSLPLLIVVMNDAALDLIRSAQDRRGRDRFGTEFENPDFAKIADAYNIGYAKVSTELEMGDAVSRATREIGVTLIDVQIDPGGYPTTVN